MARIIIVDDRKPFKDFYSLMEDIRDGGI